MRTTIATIASLACALALTSACAKKDEEKKPEPAPKTTEPPKPEVPKEMSPEDKLTMVQGCWEAADAKNTDKLKECYGADAVLRMVDSVPPVEAKGPDGAIGVLQGYWTAFPDLDHQLGLIALHGDKVAVFGTVKGTHEGELMGMPATKKPMAMWFAQIAELKDGKVVRQEHYSDAPTMLAQLGVAPNPMAPAADKIEAPDDTATAMAGGDAEAEQAHLDIWKKSEELMKNKDYKGMIDLYADDAEFNFVASAETSQGKDKIGKDMQMWTDMHSEMSGTTRDVWAAGDWVVAETTVKGTLAKDMPGTKVKTKGKSYEAQYLEFLHFNDENKVDKHWIFANTSKWAADLGLMDPSKMGAGADKGADKGAEK